MFQNCRNSSKNNESERTVKIGAILPLTGNLASYGVDTRKAVELAVEQLNNQGGLNGKKIIVVFEDSQGQSSKAVNICKKLIEIDKVIGILGPITSPEVLSISPLANRGKVPIISPSSTSVDISNAGEYVFRTINADNIETIAFSKFVKSRFNNLRIAIIANQAAGTLSYANSFEKYYNDLDHKVIDKVLFQENIIDFKNIIQKALQNNPDALYISGVSQDIGLIAKQIREANKDVQLLSYQSAEDERVLELAGTAINDMYYSSTSLPEGYIGDVRMEFMKEFNKSYGNYPGIFACEIYDATNILLNAYGNSNGQDDFIERLNKTNNYKGTSGIITFDENGDVNKPISIWRYKNLKREILFVVEKDTIQKL